MKSSLVLKGAAVILALATQAAPAPPAPAQTAREEGRAAALRDLREALSSHASHASAGYVRRLDARDFRGCRITYDLTPQTPPGHKGFAPSAERTTLDLSALDAASVKVREGRGGATVSFAARGGARVIERRLGEGPHAFGGATRLSSAHVFVPEKAAAEVVRAALVRAIEACGK